MPTSKQVRNIVLIKVHRRGSTYSDFRIRFPLVCMQHQQQIDGLLNNTLALVAAPSTVPTSVYLSSCSSSITTFVDFECCLCAVLCPRQNIARISRDGY